MTLKTLLFFLTAFAGMTTVFSTELAGQVFKNWTNDTNSNALWQTGSNWDPSGEPGILDTTDFNLGSDHQVWWDANTNSHVSALRVLAGDISFLNLTSDLTTIRTDRFFAVVGSSTSLTVSGLELSVGTETTIASSATATIDGSHSAPTFLNTQELRVISEGTLNVVNGALVDAGTIQVGFARGSMNVESGSSVSSIGDIRIAFEAPGQGVVTVSNALLSTNSRLLLGGGGQGQGLLNIGSGGFVSVGTETIIASDGAVQLSGGFLNFGTANNESLTRINGVGSLAGVVHNDVVTGVANLTGLQSNSINMIGVELRNTSQLQGSGLLASSVINAASGEIRTQQFDWLRFAGDGNNYGEINNLGGTIEFGGQLLNDLGGFVGGRGTFATQEGTVNQSTMAFSGTTDVFGDVFNLSGGQIVTSGGATTTFFDDVEHNGTEIRTSLNSSTVFFGEVTGAGAFTGSGEIYFEGDLRPGNSPAIVSLEGDVALGSSAHSFFEIAGRSLGEFDRLEIGGDLEVNGLLSVQAIDGFTLAYLDEFLIAEIGGDLTGRFEGLGEGDLVGRFGSVDLFISYGMGDGNDIGLYAAAVPEPSSAVLGGWLFGFLFLRRLH